MSSSGDNVHSLFGEGMRQPPANVQAEQALLGAILATSKAHAAVEGFLRPEHFADPVNARLFAIVDKLIRGGHLADVVTLRTDLAGAGILDEVGGLKYLAQLQAAMVTPRSAGEYGRVIREAWERRQMIQAAQDLMDRAFAGGEDPAAFLSEHRGVLDKLDGDVAGGLRNRSTTLGEAVDQALAAADAAFQGGGAVRMSTGMPSIDAVLGGFEPGSLTVLGGRPGSGKSSLGHQWALFLARQGIPVAEFSLEMSAASLGRRALSIASGVPIWKMKRGQHQDDIEALVRARRELHDLPLEIFDGQRYGASEIATKARGMARRRGLGLILVDHLHLVPPDAAAARHGPTAGVTEVVDSLLGVAKQLGVPMLLLAQLNRGVEGRDDHRPGLADLRQSGAIEQNADAVGFVYRPELHLSKSPPERAVNDSDEGFAKKQSQWHTQKARLSGVAEVIFEKIRDGEPASIPLKFDGQTASFREACNV